MRYAICALMLFIFTAPVHAASITDGTITGNVGTILVNVFGPDASAFGQPDFGNFSAVPFLVRPGETVNVQMAIFTGAFATVDGIPGSQMAGFPDSSIQAFGHVSITIPGDANASYLSLPGPGTLTGSLNFRTTTFSQVIPFSLTGLGTVAFSGFGCPNGDPVCYQATSASLTARAVPEPSTWALVVTGLVALMMRRITRRASREQRLWLNPSHSRVGSHPDGNLLTPGAAPLASPQAPPCKRATVQTYLSPWLPEAKLRKDNMTR
jgi:hypothetical protein